MTAAARTRLIATATLAALTALAACGPRPPVVRPEAQGLLIVCPVADALILVDDRVVGNAATLRRRELPILPGVHRIEVQAERHFPRYAEVEIPPGGHVRIELTPRLRPDVP
jgi:hypothetical protein